MNGNRNDDSQKKFAISFAKEYIFRQNQKEGKVKKCERQQIILKKLNKEGKIKGNQLKKKEINKKRIQNYIDKNGSPSEKFFIFFILNQNQILQSSYFRSIISKQPNKNIQLNLKYNILRMDLLIQRSFQKQDAVFLNSKKVLAKKSASGVRYYKNVGLGFKTPKEAIDGHYIDKKCPFTSNLSIRGKIIKGLVISTKMDRTVIIRRDYLHYVRKYNRYEKRHRNIPVHISPCFSVKEGDILVAGQCRPISKTVRFNTLQVVPNEIVGSVRKQFLLF